MIFWLWKSLSLWAPLLVGVAHQNPPLTTTRPPTKFSSTKSWAAFQKIFKACSLLFGKLLQHGLSLENLVGHAVITAVNVIDVFISSRPWRCLHVYQVFSYMWLSISVLSCWKKWKRKRWIYLHNQKHVFQTQLFCLTYSLSSLVTVEEEGNSEVVIAIYSRV